MDFSEREKGIMLDLIKVAWQAGAIRSEEQAAEVKGIKLKLSADESGLKKVE